MVVVEAVACRHVEPGVTPRFELGDPLAAVLRLAELGEDVLVGAPVCEGAVDALVECRSGERLQLVVGPEHGRVVAGDHLGHRLRAHVGESALTELEEGQVGAIREQEQLEVELVQLVVELQRAVV